ncbi:MAG TPA: hemerythrin domain-containing protein [Burkholderiaceae bacterium]|nr:hemerythrin domain-containing protein [Burkholderiaceae bacterium]
MNEKNTRHDIYAAVHKGLRACMAHVLVEAGRMDTTDADDTAQALGSMRHLLLLCRTHLEHEDRFVHAAMEARCPGSAATTRGDHEHHVRSIVQLESAARAVEDSAGEARRSAARALYTLLSRFVAENYEHMHVEETRNNIVLWAEYTDAELIALKGRLIAAIPPEVNMAFMRWMAPSLSPLERAELLGNARQGMPAAAFDAALAMIKNHLSTRDWFKLQVALAPLAHAA